MARTWGFQLATRVISGRGAVRQLGSIVREVGRAALLVGYREPGGLAEVYQRAAQTMERAGVRVVRLNAADPEPTAEAILEAVPLAKDAEADLVVGLGGGSVLDVAKGLAALAWPGMESGKAANSSTLFSPIRGALPLVAVPTTAGTGSEVSSVAVFSGAGDPLKTTIHSPAITPLVALVDPELAAGSPPALTAASGADALGHAIEAFLSRQANSVTSLLAARAVSLIVENLPRAVQAPQAPEPREPLALAATLAGAAFNEAGVTVSHALAHGLGAVLRVPHAVAVAIATPVNLRYNFDECIDRYAELANACRFPGDSGRQRAERFVETVVQLLRSVGLPERAAVPANAPADLLDRLVRSATQSTRIALTLNPRKVDAAALRALFAECLEPAATPN